MMTEQERIQDIVNRAEKLLNKIHLDKNDREADRIFKKPKREEQKEAERKKQEEQERNEVMERWQPWVDKAKQRQEQEHQKIMDSIKRLRQN